MTHAYALDAVPVSTLAEATALVGGKAANLAVMAGELGLPVPPGFVITTETCRTFLAERLASQASTTSCEPGWPRSRRRSGATSAIPRIRSSSASDPAPRSRCPA